MVGVIEENRQSLGVVRETPNQYFQEHFGYSKLEANMIARERKLVRENNGTTLR